MLGDLVKTLAKTGKYGKPVMELADALREGGNLAAHFTPGHSVSEDIARQVLDLTDYWIDYLYLLPQQVASLVANVQGAQVVAPSP